MQKSRRGRDGGLVVASQAFHAMPVDVSASRNVFTAHRFSSLDELTFNRDFDMSDSYAKKER